MKMIALNEFQERVHSWASDNFDMRSDSKDMLFHGEDDIEVFSDPVPIGDGENSLVMASRLQLDDHTKNQLSFRFKLPKRYMFNDEYFPEDLRKECFEHKFRSKPQDDLLIRCRHSSEGDQCRGILTKDYRPYDNTEFIDAVVDAVTLKGVNPETVKVGSWSIGSEMRGIGIIPNITFDQWSNGGPSTADGGGSGGIHPGFKFGNSERGLMRTRMDGGGWRSYCDNGVVYGFQENAGFRIVHRGKKVMSLLVNEGIADALLMSERGAQKFMEKMSLKVERTDLDEIITGWSNKYGFTVESTEAWKGLVTAHALSGPITEFDVINDLTMIARDVESVEEQELLQVTAGDMTFTDSIERGLRYRP